MPDTDLNLSFGINSTNFENAIIEMNKKLAILDANIRQITRSLKAMSNQSIKTYKTMGNINKVTKQAVTQHNRLTKAVTDANIRTQKFTQSLKTQQTTMSAVSLSLKGFAQLVAVQLAHRAISGLVRAVREGVTE